MRSPFAAVIGTMSLSAVLSLCTSTALGQDSKSVELPDVRPNNSWTFVTSDYYTKQARSESQLTVTAVTNESIRATQTSGTRTTTVTRGRDWSIRQKDNPPIQYFVFPLELGRRWKYSTRFVHPTCGDANTDWSAHAARWEEIVVPAGKYRAMRIDHEGAWTHACGGGRVTRKYWYVPELKYFAKLEFIDYGDGNRVVDAYTQELKFVSLDP